MAKKQGGLRKGSGRKPTGKTTQAIRVRIKIAQYVLDNQDEIQDLVEGRKVLVPQGDWEG